VNRAGIGAPSFPGPGAPLRAVTLRRPWGWAVVHAGKPVENRTWATSYRGQLLIHQGQGSDRDAAAWFPPLTQAIAEDPDSSLIWAPGVILGVVTLTGCHHAEPGCCTSRWAMPEQWHWMFTDSWSLVEPVPARGALQLWIPGPDLLAAVAGASAGAS
jgi:hypothetical protein